MKTGPKLPAIKVKVHVMTKTRAKLPSMCKRCQVYRDVAHVADVHRDCCGVAFLGVGIDGLSMSRFTSVVPSVTIVVNIVFVVHIVTFSWKGGWLSRSRDARW